MEFKFSKKAKIFSSLITIGKHSLLIVLIGIFSAILFGCASDTLEAPKETTTPTPTPLPTLAPTVTPPDENSHITMTISPPADIEATYVENEWRWYMTTTISETAGIGVNLSHYLVEHYSDQNIHLNTDDMSDQIVDQFGTNRIQPFASVDNGGYGWYYAKPSAGAVGWKMRFAVEGIDDQQNTIGANAWVNCLTPDYPYDGIWQGQWTTTSKAVGAVNFVVNKNHISGTHFTEFSADIIGNSFHFYAKWEENNIVYYEYTIDGAFDHDRVNGTWLKKEFGKDPLSGTWFADKISGK